MPQNEEQTFSRLIWFELGPSWCGDSPNIRMCGGRNWGRQPVRPVSTTSMRHTLNTLDDRCRFARAAYSETLAWRFLPISFSMPAFSRRALRFYDYRNRSAAISRKTDPTASGFRTTEVHRTNLIPTILPRRHMTSHTVLSTEFGMRFRRNRVGSSVAPSSRILAPVSETSINWHSRFAKEPSTVIQAAIDWRLRRTARLSFLGTVQTWRWSLS